MPDSSRRPPAPPGSGPASDRPASSRPSIPRPAVPPRPGSQPPPAVPFALRHQLLTPSPATPWTPGHAPPLASDGPLTERPPESPSFSYRENATHPLRPLIDIAQPRLAITVDRENGADV